MHSTCPSHAFTGCCEDGQCRSFAAESRDITRRSLAAKAKRDREFMGLLALLIVFIIALPVGLWKLEQQQGRQDLINQEQVAFK